jgi:hypothetical protein
MVASLCNPSDTREWQPSLLGCLLDKSETCGDWEARPLTEAGLYKLNSADP